MEYKQRRETISVNEQICSSSREQPIDLEVTLPDYCADIQKILKCQLSPVVTAAGLVGDSADINGNTTVRVLYLDPQGEKLRCYETTVPFDVHIPVKTTTGSGIVLPQIHVDYVNCRATGSRRLDIHGSFSVCADVLEQREIALLCRVEDSDVEQLPQEAEISVSAGLTQQIFTVEEVLTLGDSKPCAEQILRTDGVVMTEECRSVNGKLQVKGHIALKVLYLTDLSDGMPEMMTYALPFQQILDCDADCGKQAITVQLLGISVQIRSDGSGENTLLQAEARLSASAQCYADHTVQLLEDAYSRTTEVTLEQQSRTFLRYETTCDDTCSAKSIFEFPESGITKILDLWNDTCTVAASVEDGVLTYKGKYNLCMLAVNQEGKLFYFERMQELEHTRDIGSTEGVLRCRPQAAVTNLTYRITGSASMEVKAELHLEAAVFAAQICRFVEEVIPNPDLAKVKETAASLVLYYTDGRETLWDIAKKYAVSAAEIREENNLAESEPVNPGMILIPLS